MIGEPPQPRRPARYQTAGLARRRTIVERLESGAAHAAGETWIFAAADFLSVGRNGKKYGRVESILRDMETQKLLPKVDAAYQRRDEERRGAPTHDVAFNRFRATILMLMAFCGGPLPKEPPGQIRKRRRKLAARVRRLAEVIGDETELRRKPPSMVQLADELEAGNPLTWRDPIDRAPWIPQPGRETAQQILLERRLCMEFISPVRAPPYALVAKLVEVALNAPAAIDAERVEERWRDYVASLSR